MGFKRRSQHIENEISKKFLKCSDEAIRMKSRFFALTKEIQQSEQHCLSYKKFPLEHQLSASITFVSSEKVIFYIKSIPFFFQNYTQKSKTKELIEAQ